MKAIIKNTSRRLSLVHRAGLIAALAGCGLVSSCAEATRNALDPNTLEGFLTNATVFAVAGGGTGSTAATTIPFVATEVNIDASSSIFLSGLINPNTMGIARLVVAGNGTISVTSVTQQQAGLTSVFNAVGNGAGASDFFGMGDQGLVQVIATSSTEGTPSFPANATGITFPAASTRKMLDPIQGNIVTVDSGGTLQCYSTSTFSWTAGAAVSQGSAFFVRTVNSSSFESIYVPQDGTAIRTMGASCGSTPNGTTPFAADLPSALTYSLNLGNTYIVTGFGAKLFECTGVTPAACNPGNMSDITSQLALNAGDSINGIAASEDRLVVLIKPAATADDVMVKVRTPAAPGSFTTVTVPKVGTIAPFPGWLAYSEFVNKFYMSGGSDSAVLSYVLQSDDGLTWTQ